MYICALYDYILYIYVCVCVCIHNIKTYMVYKIYIRKTWNIESMYKIEEYLDCQQHL